MLSLIPTSIDRPKMFESIFHSVFGKSFLARKTTPEVKQHRSLSLKALTISNAGRLISFFKSGFVAAAKEVKPLDKLNIS